MSQDWNETDTGVSAHMNDTANSLDTEDTEGCRDVTRYCWRLFYFIICSLSVSILVSIAEVVYSRKCKKTLLEVNWLLTNLPEDDRVKFCLYIAVLICLISYSNKTKNSVC